MATSSEREPTVSAMSGKPPTLAVTMTTLSTSCRGGEREREEKDHQQLHTPQKHIVHRPYNYIIIILWHEILAGVHVLAMYMYLVICAFCKIGGL